jgi:hypothetical protein
MGKSLRMVGTETEGEQHKEVYFWLVVGRGFPQAGASSQILDTNSHTLGMPLLVWCTNHTGLGPAEMSLYAVAKILCASLKCCRPVSRVLVFTGQGTGP